MSLLRWVQELWAELKSWGQDFETFPLDVKISASFLEKFCCWAGVLKDVDRPVWGSASCKIYKSQDSLLFKEKIGRRDICCG